MTRRAPDAPQAVRDDGSVLTVDVHGCTVDAAMRIVRRAVALAVQRGRGSVEVIHGLGGVIAGRLEAEGVPGATGNFRQGGRTLFSLPLGGGGSDPARITAADLVG
ncbi:MAG: Smr/MutS family protein [Rhodothermales bacterium]|nr:Smr/MutS family protein [Rhodothermales bacterium]MBO6779968.1 Smr/MutS family protein [Rhodothermales bacterium]